MPIAVTFEKPFCRHVGSHQFVDEVELIALPQKLPSQVMSEGRVQYRTENADKKNEFEEI